MSDTNEVEPKGPRVPPPPPKRNRGIIAPVPVTEQAPDNMQKPNSGTQDMNFKVDPIFHQAFKVTAAMRKMPMKDLLEAAYRCWLEHYGSDAERTMLPPKVDK